MAPLRRRALMLAIAAVALAVVGVLSWHGGPLGKRDPADFAATRDRITALEREAEQASKAQRATVESYKPTVPGDRGTKEGH